MKRLVLVGGGHAHAQVLAEWGRRPVAGVELQVVSPDRESAYSGMVPGWLAGLYRDDDICIDIASLCARASATFLQGEMIGLDPSARRIRLAGGASLDYDVLSLDVGSTLHPPAIPGAIPLSLRPLSGLRARWDALLATLASEPDKAVRILGAGGGPAGFESLLALHHRLRASGSGRSIEATLVSASRVPLPRLARGVSRRAARTLAERGISLAVDTTFDDRSSAPPTRGVDVINVILWATGARAHAWQRTCGLAVDESDYFRVDRFLRSTSHPDVFASGDCASWHRPLPKSGVYAVRMGRVLNRNLRAACGDGRLRAYRPQRRQLVLLSTADRRAIASWGPFCWSGRAVWHWKDRLDRRFLARFASSELSSNALPSKESS